MRKAAETCVSTSAAPQVDRAPGGMAGMSSCLSFPLALLGPSGAHWLDDLPDVTWKESTRQRAVDDPLMSCNQLPCQERPGPARLNGSLGGNPPGVTRQESGGLAGFDP